MSTPQLERLRAHCHRLSLYQVEAELATLLEQAAKKDLAYSDFLDELLALEVRSKTEKHLSMRINMARFTLIGSIALTVLIWLVAFIAF